MKKTNVALLRNVRLAKVLPLFFAFFVVSAVQLSAQSFLPFEDAMVQLKSSIEDMQEDNSSFARLDVTMNSLSSSQKQALFTEHYLNFYADKAAELKDLEGALEAVDEVYNIDDMKEGVQRDAVIDARDELLDIISE